MNKIINISLFAIAFFVPHYFIGMNQPISLKEQAAAIKGKSINKEELAKLKAEFSEDIYNPIAKKALPNIVKSIKANNIWEAVTDIKRLSNDTLNSDPELAGQLINKLADQYKIDFNKLLILSRNPSILWNNIQGAEHTHFVSDTYINFAAEVLNTPGAKQWLKQNPLKNVARLLVPESRPK